MNPLRWSDLKHILVSPAHFKYRRERGVPETSYMRVGALADHLVMPGKRQFALYDGVRRGLEWTRFRADNPTHTILNKREWSEASAIAGSILGNSKAMEVLTGTKQGTFHWNIGDEPCIGTPDVVGDGFISDLKVTADASPNRFARHAMRMLWPAQLAWYSNGLRLKGLDVKEHYIVAVESKPPYLVQPYLLSDLSMEWGDRKWREAFERYRYCTENDYWPGYADGIASLDVPVETEGTFVPDEEESNELA